MSIFFVGLPAAVIGCVIEIAVDRITKPKLKRGGDVTKFSYKR